MTFAYHDDKSVVWAVGALGRSGVIDGSAEEMCGRIGARAVDIVVFEILAHCDPIGGACVV